MLIVIREKIEVERKEKEGEKMKDKMDYMIRIGKISWRIVGIYTNEDLGKKMDGIKE
jgi:hypothetical protein